MNCFQSIKQEHTHTQAITRLFVTKSFAFKITQNGTEISVEIIVSNH